MKPRTNVTTIGRGLQKVNVDPVLHERVRRQAAALTALGGNESITSYTAGALEQRLDREGAPKLDLPPAA